MSDNNLALAAGAAVAMALVGAALFCGGGGGEPAKKGKTGKGGKGGSSKDKGGKKPKEIEGKGKTKGKGAKGIKGKGQKGKPAPEPEPPATFANDEIDADEMAKLRAMRGRGGGGRRVGVSAETQDDSAESDIEEKPIAKTDEQLDRIEHAIEHNFLFANLDSKERAEVVGLMFERICTKGETIIEQGAPGDNFYVLEQGKVSVAVNDKQVATLEPGASFGELALMYNSPRAATIVAEGKCTLWAMTRQTFRKKVNNAAAAKRDKYKDFLKGVALLQNIEDYERNQIADALTESDYADGDTIIAQGDEGADMYILVEGAAKALIKGVKGHLNGGAVKMYKPGDYFGELALMTDSKRAATIKATGQAKCVVLDREVFEGLIGKCQDILQRTSSGYNNIDDDAE